SSRSRILLLGDKVSALSNGPNYHYTMTKRFGAPAATMLVDEFTPRQSAALRGRNAADRPSLRTGESAWAATLRLGASRRTAAAILYREVADEPLIWEMTAQMTIGVAFAPQNRRGALWSNSTVIILIANLAL